MGHKLSNKVGSDLNIKSRLNFFYVAGAFSSVIITVLVTVLLVYGKSGYLTLGLGTTLPSLIVPFVVGWTFKALSQNPREAKNINLKSCAMGAFGTIWLLPLFMLTGFQKLVDLINGISSNF